MHVVVVVAAVDGCDAAVDDVVAAAVGDDVDVAAAVT